MKRYGLIRIMTGALIVAGSFGALAVRAQEAPPDSGYIPVKGLNMYYETYGSGEPLVLLHGGMGGTVEFAALAPTLAQQRQVIAVELQGHGHTADIDRPLTYEALADDVAALIEALGYESADVMGYSLGGGVALQMAIRHPESVRRLVLVSTPFRRNAIHEPFRAGMSSMSAENADTLAGSPMHQFYLSAAPDPENWPTLVGKLGEMLSADYDWSAEVAEVTAPTLILVGDSDMIPPAHAADMFTLLGGGVPGDFTTAPASQLAVLPGTTHFTILSRTDLLLPVLTPFLTTPMPEAA